MKVKWSYLDIMRGGLQAEAEHSIKEKHSNIWRWFHEAVGLCAQCRDWTSVTVEGQRDSSQYQQILENNVQESKVKGDKVVADISTRQH